MGSNGSHKLNDGLHIKCWTKVMKWRMKMHREKAVGRAEGKREEGMKMRKEAMRDGEKE